MAITPKPPVDPAPPPGGAGTPPPPSGPAVAPDDLKTAQEADTSGETPGVGPAGKPKDTPGPAETIEAQGIGPRTPYPTGKGPAPPEEKEKS